MLDALGIIGNTVGEFWNLKFKRAKSTKRLQDYFQFVIQGQGTEDFSQSSVGKGRIGVWKVGDPHDIMTILGYLTTSSELDATNEFFAVYTSDPRNISEGFLIDKGLYLFREVQETEMTNYEPGYYRYMDLETGETDSMLWTYIGDNTMKRTGKAWLLKIETK